MLLRRSAGLRRVAERRIAPPGKRGTSARHPRSSDRMPGEPRRAARSVAAQIPAEPAPQTAKAIPHARFWPMAVGAVGVVFGDIGTSPLYAFRQALQQATDARGVRA